MPENSEKVNHPAHYGGADNPYEAIKVIEAWRLNFNLGNAVKYICRAPFKGRVEDLKKATWYLQREIQRALDIPPRPKIVCLCGSTRFRETFQQQNYRLTLQGKIVLSVGFFVHASECRHCGHAQDSVTREKHRAVSGKCWQCQNNLGCSDEEKLQLDELHKRKIDLADEVLVLNVGGYVGESTKSEITYAVRHGKTIRYLEDPPGYEAPAGRHASGGPMVSCDREQTKLNSGKGSDL